MEPFLAHIALVWEVLGVHGDDVTLQVTRVGALMLAVRALVRLVALEDLHVPLQLLVVCESLGAVAAFERQVSAMFALNVSL